jgi:hypothetical protein
MKVPAKKHGFPAKNLLPYKSRLRSILEQEQPIPVCSEGGDHDFGKT